MTPGPVAGGDKYDQVSSAEIGELFRDQEDRDLDALG